MSDETQFPIRMKRGGNVVKIYRAFQKGREGYMLDYHIGSKRKQQRVSRLPEAKRKANEILTKMQQGEIEVLTLKDKDKAEYVRAKGALKSAGVSLETACKEYAEAVEILGSTSILEAARYYAKRHPQNLPRKTVSDVLSEFLAAKRQQGVTEHYLRTIKFHLDTFAEAFQVDVKDVASSDIADFLQQLSGSNRHRNNVRASIRTLLGFCVQRGYLPRDHEGVELVPKFKEQAAEMSLLSVEEMGRLLIHARDELVPFLTIAGFAGLRTAEIQRLDWQQVRLAEEYIEIRAGKSKTGSRRLAPISGNLKAWLQPYWKQQGPVIPPITLFYEIEQLAKQAGVQWRQNVLRHSFISYRLALVQDAAKVALEAGNSANVVHREYKELVTASDAERWFAIWPSSMESSGKVVTL